MAKATSIADALKQWEDKTSKRAAEAKVIDLQFMFGPIEKMDNTLGTLVTCEKLSLSSNNIDRIQGLNGMKSLKILSLARNNIKSLSGVEAVAETLEELWVSHNKIDRVKQVSSLKKLTVFYISYNLMRDWAELNNIAQTPVTHLILIGNPMHESAPDEETYKGNVLKRVPKLKVLDGVPCVSQPWDT